MLLPLARKAAVTVRRPWAKSVPVNNVISFLQVGAVNSGRKTTKTSIIGAGRDMNILRGLDSTLISFYFTSRDFMPPSFPKMYKVELRDCLKRSALGTYLWRFLALHSCSRLFEVAWRFLALRSCSRLFEVTWRFLALRSCSRLFEITWHFLALRSCSRLFEITWRARW